jgi:hypothetical protein
MINNAFALAIVICVQCINMFQQSVEKFVNILRKSLPISFASYA